MPSRSWVAVTPAHGQSDEVDQLLRVDGVQRRAEQEVGLGVDAQLDQPVGLTEDLRAGHGGDRRDRLHVDGDGDPLRPQGLLALPHPREGRRQEGRRRHGHAVGARACTVAGELVEDDAVVIVGEVGLLQAAGDIADGEDALGARAQVVVDDDGTGVVDVDPGRVEPEALGGRHPTDGDEHGMGRQRPAWADVHRHRLAVVLDGRHLGPRPDRHPRITQCLLDGLGHVGVLAGEDPLAPLEEGDLGAEAGEHARELQCHRPAADDDEPSGEGGDVLDRRGVVDTRPIGAGDVEPAWDGAGVDDDRLRRDLEILRSAGDADPAWPGEVRPPTDDDAHRVDGLEHLPVDGIEPVDESISRVDRLIEPRRGIVLLAADLGLVHERLGGDAPDVDAGPSDHAGGLLDDGHGAPRPAEGSGEALARLAPPDDEDVGLHGLSHGPRLRAAGRHPARRRG